MKCSKAQGLINDYVDNLLDINDIRILKSHIEECAECRDLLNDFGRIVDDAREIENIQPSRNVWPEIRRGVLKKDRAGEPSLLGKPSFSSGRWLFALSTLVVIIIFTPLIYFGLHYIGNSGIDQKQIALNHFKKAEQHYQTAIEALESAIGSRDEELSPELAAVFKKNLEIIDDSIRICRAAVKKHPENSEANKFLLICYRKKIEILNEITELTMQAG